MKNIIDCLDFIQNKIKPQMYKYKNNLGTKDAFIKAMNDLGYQIIISPNGDPYYYNEKEDWGIKLIKENRKYDISYRGSKAELNTD